MYERVWEAGKIREELFIVCHKRGCQGSEILHLQWKISPISSTHMKTLCHTVTKLKDVLNNKLRMKDTKQITSKNRGRHKHTMSEERNVHLDAKYITTACSCQSEEAEAGHVSNLVMVFFSFFKYK